MRWLLLLLLPLTGTLADEIDLSNGAKLTGEVTVYTNLTFHFFGADGQSAKQPAAFVKSITFADRGRDSTFHLRSGPVSGKLLRYENNTFSYEDAKGKRHTLASIFVRSLRVPFAAPPEIEGSTGNELIIPEALSRGAPIDSTNLVVAGKVTVVFFYGNVGAPGIQCRLMNNFLDNVLKDDKRVAVRKVDIGEWDSPVAQQYQVTALPRVDIYDSTGKLTQSLIGNRQPELTAILRRIR